MRIRLLYFFAMTLITSVARSQIKPQLNSGRVEYVFGSPIFKGTKSLVFTDSGAIEKIEVYKIVDTNANFSTPKGFLGNRIMYHSLIIQTRDSIYSIDLDSMSGSKRRRISFGLPTASNQTWTKVGEDTMLNRKCNIMELHGLKIWYWNGIVVKKVFPFPPNECSGCIYEYAVSIDENYVIKKDEFNVPEGTKMK